MSVVQDTYWAALPPADLIPALRGKTTDYYEFCRSYGFMDLWRRAYLAYLGMSESGTDSTRLNQVGENGDEYALRVNNLRSIITNLLTMTCSQPPAMQPQAANTDYKTFAETILAKNVLDYYLSEKDLEKQLKHACEIALFGAEGFIVPTWNATSGNIYGQNPETGAPIYDGDLEFRTFHPVDIIRDCYTENAKSKWKMVRDFRNKYDLAAKYPELAEEILSFSYSADWMKQYSYYSYLSSKSDMVPVYCFYHAQSEAMPAGRQFEFIEGMDTHLTDGPLAYQSIPVYRIAGGEWHGTPFGYSIIYSLMGIQKNSDALQSVVATNQLNYGVQSICYKRGEEVSVVALAEGLNGIEYDVAPPHPLNLVSTPPEIFNQIKNLDHAMETLSGMNSVVRGNPEASLKSGAALALVASQALLYNSGLQASYKALSEDVGTAVIEVLQEYATTPRIAAIAGKSNRSRLIEFKGSDISNIRRVRVEEVNPLSKSASGRLQMAQDLLQSGKIQTPQHYFEVVATGNLDPIYEHELSQIMMVRAENEQLQDSKNPPVMITDPHKLHILEHASVLDSPEARMNPQVVKAVTVHMQQHIQALRETDPTLLQILGQQPLPPPGTAPQPPTGPPPGPQTPAPQGPPPGAPHPAPHPSPIAATMDATHPLSQQVQKVNLPGMPSLPKQAPPELQAAYAQIKA